MNLQDDFFKFLKTHDLTLAEAGPTLLAISGGLDSMVMANLFQQSKLPFAIAHCNFQLRAQESDEDEIFVQRVAMDYGVPFFIKRFETAEYAEQKGISIQMAARALRYAWFADLAEENQFPHIATAHHLNDNVETALLNFVRGTGLAGLSGISPNNGVLIRPLLFAAKQQLVEYALNKKIDCREDSSNADDAYARNFVRHHIVPQMEALNPNFLNTAARNMERIGEADGNLLFLLKQWLSPASAQRLDKRKLAQLPAPQQALRQLLQPFGFDAEQARQVAENLQHIGLELTSEHGFTLLVDRENILISAATDPSESLPALAVQKDDLMLRLPDGGKLFFLALEQGPNSGSIEFDPDSTFVDADNLGYPLLLRHWRPGDSFQPLGMGGKSQKLQDFFTNQKISRFDKDKTWLLCNSSGAIIWVLGQRMDERFKIHTSTKKVLKINWIK